jgi:hypothetical protein
MKTSLVNRVEDIKIGMGATLLSWSDRLPATVIEFFKKGKTFYVVVQCDDYKRTDDNGMSENQEYEYSRNTDGGKATFRIEKDGSFTRVYKALKTGEYRQTEGGIIIGKRFRAHARYWALWPKMTVAEMIETYCIDDIAVSTKLKSLLDDQTEENWHIFAEEVRAQATENEEEIINAAFKLLE